MSILSKIKRLFKTRKNVEALEDLIIEVGDSVADWDKYNRMVQLQKRAEMLKQWREDTGQDMLHYTRHNQDQILKLNDDGTVYYINNRV